IMKSLSGFQYDAHVPQGIGTLPVKVGRAPVIFYLRIVKDVNVNHCSANQKHSADFHTHKTCQNNEYNKYGQDNRPIEEIV
ncbi:hypothetical protein, partial [Methanobrevibacter sp.]